MATSSAAPLADPILAVAVRAARRAASVIADASRDLRRLPTFSKEHGDIVSVADKDAEAAIRATLTNAFPDHAVLGEEEGDKGHGDATARWIVDPIDGTRNFVHGFPYYAVSIALSQAGTLTHAVVLDPVHDELFTAVRGKGAQRNGAPIHVSACTRLGEALIGTVFPTRRSPRLAPYLPMLNALMARCGGIRRAGACALDLAHLAAGRLDGFFVTSLGPWDVAAGALLVVEAGGRVGDFAGGNDFLSSQEVIAAAPGLFNPLRDALLGARPF